MGLQVRLDRSCNARTREEPSHDITVLDPFLSPSPVHPFPFNPSLFITHLSLWIGNDASTSDETSCLPFAKTIMAVNECPFPVNLRKLMFCAPEFVCLVPGHQNIFIPGFFRTQFDILTNSQHARRSNMVLR